MLIYRRVYKKITTKNHKQICFLVCLRMAYTYTYHGPADPSDPCGIIIPRSKKPLLIHLNLLGITIILQL